MQEVLDNYLYDLKQLIDGFSFLNLHIFEVYYVLSIKPLNYCAHFHLL